MIFNFHIRFIKPINTVPIAACWCRLCPHHAYSGGRAQRQNRLGIDSCWSTRQPDHSPRATRSQNTNSSVNIWNIIELFIIAFYNIAKFLNIIILPNSNIIIFINFQIMTNLVVQKKYLCSLSAQIPLNFWEIELQNQYFVGIFLQGRPPNSIFYVQHCSPTTVGHLPWSGKFWFILMLESGVFWSLEWYWLDLDRVDLRLIIVWTYSDFVITF